MRSSLSRRQPQLTRTPWVVLSRIADRPLETSIRAIRTNELVSGAAGVLLRLGTVSAINGDKARFHRERKSKLARRERSQALRKKLKASAPRRPDGRDLESARNTALP